MTSAQSRSITQPRSGPSSRSAASTLGRGRRATAVARQSLVTLLGFGIIVAGVSPAMLQAGQPDGPSSITTRLVDMTESGSNDATACTAAVMEGQSIQAAVDIAAAQGGGKVCLDKGTWTLSQSLQLVSNVTLRGAGAGTVLQGPRTPYSWPLITSNAVDGDVHDITVADLVVDGRVPFSAAFDKNNGYKEAQGLFFFNVTRPGWNLRFSGLEVRNTAQGMHVKGFTDVVVENSYFHENGVVLDAGPLFTHNVYLLRVTNALLSNVRSTNAWDGSGAHFRRMDGTVVVRDSTFSGNYGRGLHAQWDDKTKFPRFIMTNSEVSDNGRTMANDYGNGFDQDSASGSLVGNLFAGNGRYGLLSRKGSGTFEANIALGNGAALPIETQLRRYSTGLTKGANVERQAPIADGTYRVLNGDGRALTYDRRGSVIAQKFSGRATQWWRLQHQGDATYTIRRASGPSAERLLTAAGSASGSTDVSMRDEDPANQESQLWRAVPVAGGGFRLCSVASPGVCLTSGGEKQLVTSASYASAGRQSWTLLPV